MKPALPELQSLLAAALRQPADSRVLDLLRDDGLAAALRLQIYRNNHRETLLQTLRLTYPAVLKLVGEDFFDHVGATFVMQYAAGSAWLERYGAAFPTFLAEHARTAGLSYLGDVARLELLVNQARCADDAEACDPAALMALDERSAASVRFQPHPALGLMRAAAPVDLIRAAALAGDELRLAALDVDAGPVHLLVSRGAEGVEVRRLEAGAWRFAEALMMGQCLGQALQHAGVDVTSWLTEHLVRGDFTAFTVGEGR